MYRRLSYLPPLTWLEKLPPSQFEFHVASQKWRWRPVTRAVIVDEWEKYVFGALASHALRLMNLDWEHDFEETRATLLRDLERQAIAAGKRAGLQFVDRPSNDRRTLEGNPSSRWLRGAVESVVDLVLEDWDPNKAERRVRAARLGGQRSKRPSQFTPADLPPGSIKAQAEALGVSRATISRLRRAARSEGGA